MSELVERSSFSPLSEEDALRLLERISSVGLMERDKAEGLVYALMEISASMATIFGKLIPAAIENAPSPEALQEQLWNLREEFRHVAYHIDDGGLTEL